MSPIRPIVVAMTLGACLASAGLSHARSQPASLGRTVHAVDIPCFTLQSSAMAHTGCADEPTPIHYRSFELPLVIEDAGSHWVKVSQKTPVVGGRYTSCRAYGLSKDGVAISGGRWVSNTRFDVQEDIVLRGIAVPAEGYAYANCWVARDAILYNVVFSRE